MTEAAMERALEESVAEVLEKMFFVEGPNETADREAAAPAEEIAVRVEFEGEPSGCLQLRLPSAAARQIAADFLGLAPEEVSEACMGEVVRELANMICGSLLSRVESAVRFQLAAPQIVPPTEPVAHSLPAARMAVELQNGKLAVQVTTESPRCLQPNQSAS